MEPVNIYKQSLVINDVEIAGNTSRVTCVECCGSRMFIGTAEGFLIEYFMSDDTADAHFTRVRHTDLNNKNQAVQFLRSASAIDSLLILSGNYLVLYDIQTLEQKGKELRNVSAVSVDENPFSSDAFVVEFCFSRKTSIHLGQANDKGFTIAREIVVDAVALTMSMESGLICAALATGYYIMLNTSIKNSKPIQLCTFDVRDKPQTVHVKKSEFLVLGPGGLGVFVTKEGSSERPPISWPHKVSHIKVHNQLYILGMGQDVIYVYSLIDYETCHMIRFKGLLKCLSLTEGNLYVFCSKSLFKLNPVSVQDQIETLLASDEIEKALTLLELSRLKPSEQQHLAEIIQRKAVFVHLSKLNLDSAAEAIRISNIDVMREVLSLFPTILPGSSTFARALPSCHNFDDIQDLTGKDVAKERAIGSYLARCLVEMDSVRTSKELSTAVFKLSVKYDQACSFEVLLSITNQLPLDITDLLAWLESHKYYCCLADVHVALDQVPKAVQLWISILEQKIFPVDEAIFQGIPIVIDTLVRSTDTSLVWSSFEKLVVINPAAAVEIFTKKPISAAYPPLRVAEKLKKWPSVCIMYLEHCVDAKDVQDEDCHTYLATMYIDLILNDDPCKEELSIKLRQFLIQSNCLKLQFLIGRLTNTILRHERAILHGKAGDHTPALLLFTTELNDHKMAREYCKSLKRKEERKEGFLLLFRIYLEQDTDGDYRLPESSHSNVVNLLTDFGEEFDLSQVLGMLPDDWSLNVVASVLFRAVRTTVHKRRQAELLTGLSRRVRVDVTLRSFMTNQGYILDSDSICAVCHKQLDLTDPIFCKQGHVVHEKCK